MLVCCEQRGLGFFRCAVNSAGECLRDLFPVLAYNEYLFDFTVRVNRASVVLHLAPPDYRDHVSPYLTQLSSVIFYIVDFKGNIVVNRYAVSTLWRVENT